MTAKVPAEDAAPLLSVPVHEDGQLLTTSRALLAALERLLERPYAPQPAGTGTGHWIATAANTLYPAVLSGVLGQVWNRPVQKIKLSVGAAGLVVIGNSLAAPGAASYGEIVRFKAPAAGVFDFDFGQGLPPAALGGNGQFTFWSDTAGLVVDIEVQHG